MNPLRRLSAKIAKQRIQKHLLSSLTPQDEAFRSAFVDFVCSQESKESATQIDKFILNVAGKVLYYLTEGDIQATDIDTLHKPITDLITEFKKDDAWDVDAIRRLWDHIHSVIEGQLQQLIRGQTLARLKCIYDFITNSDNINAVCQRSTDSAKEFRRILDERIATMEVSPRFVTQYLIDRDERHASERITQELKRDYHANALVFKVLLLGAGESGKSTMMNQLQNIYHAKAPDIISPIQNNTQFYRTVLFENVVESVIALLNAYHAKHDGFPEEISEHCAWAENLELSRELSPDDAERLHRIWQHKPMRQSFRKLSKEFYIPDSTPYYLKNVGRFCAEDFEPSSEDRLMSRIRTMGVRTKQFPHPPVRFEFVDVGGQRNERRKWIHCFDDVKAVFYVVNLAGYNKVTFEEKDQNRMQEAASLFKKTMQNKVFKKTPVYLFLNKRDIFDEELQFLEPGDRGLKQCFPDYDGDLRSYEQCTSYVSQQFEQQMPAGRKLSNVFILSARHKKEVERDFETAMRELIDTNAQDIATHSQQKKKLSKR